MPSSYIPILIFIFIAIPFGGVKLIASHFFGPRKYSKTKMSVYECGVLPLSSARLSFSNKYFIIAIVFIIFDLEVAFMFPWALVFSTYIKQGVFILAEMGVFIGILLVGYIYVWKKGGLEWD